MIKILAGAAASDEGTPTERLQAPMPVSEAAAAIAEPTEQVQTPTAEELSLTDKDLLDIIYNTERGAEDIASSVDRPPTLKEQERTDYLASPDGKAVADLEHVKEIRERLRGATSGEDVRTLQRDTASKERAKGKVSSDFGPDGGIYDRAKTLEYLINNPDNPFKPEGGGGIRLNTSIGREQAALGTGSTYAQLLQDTGAATGDGSSNKVKLNPTFLRVGSLVTENFFAGEFDSADRESDALGNRSSEEPEELLPSAISKKQSSSASLGRKIFEENQREAAAAGNPPAKLDKLSSEQATLLGDSFKEIYASANPDMINRKMSGKQVVFELTNVGAAKIKASGNARRQMFPSKNVRPKKTQTPDGKQVAEGRVTAPDVAGEKGKKKVGKHKLTNEAIRNLGSVAHVVDKQRSKIYYSTLLPVLQSRSDMPGFDVWSEINSVGQSVRNKATAAKKVADATGVKYSVEHVMLGHMNKAAQTAHSIATETEGANYLTYTAQAFAGRITPNQTGFNPTTSKPVRFVTRSADFSVINKGSDTDFNIRQMYAMSLVNGASSKLDHVRERMLTEQTGHLVAWGRRLRVAVDNAMTDSELDNINLAIKSGVALDSPDFPTIRGLDLDPNNESDAKLLQAIKEHGDEGLAFIDGLIDFSKYQYARDNHKSYQSYFNAYMDGKTNGIAAMGMLMGSISIALSTGVLRTQDISVLDAGDIRDQLQEKLEVRLKDINNGLDLPDSGMRDVELALYDVALGLFKFRDFNKQTTLVFGYGMDISGFVGIMEQYAGELAATVDSMTIAEREAKGLTTFTASLDMVNQQIASNVANNPQALGSVGKYLLPTYEAGMAEVLDPDAIYVRSLMKASAHMAVLSGELFEIEGPNGFPLKLGGVDESTLGVEESRASYALNGKPKTAINYKKPEENARGVKRKEGPNGVTEKLSASGASVPAPIHATDAATITNTLSGNSWARLEKVSNGKPYIHPIYDAIKVDARSYGVAREEINNNWVKVTTGWSFLDSMVVAVKRDKQKIQKISESIPSDVFFNVDSIDPFVRSLLEMSTTADGKQYPGAITKFFSSLYPNNESDKAREIAKGFVGTMNSAGYNMYKPTSDISGAQIKKVYGFILANFNVEPKLKALSVKVKAKQKILLAKIKESGNPVRQYSEH